MKHIAGSATAGRLLGGVGPLETMLTMPTMRAPDGTAFIRRWSVEPLPANPDNAMVLQVLVITRRDFAATWSPGPRLVSLKARRAD